MGHVSVPFDRVIIVAVKNHFSTPTSKGFEIFSARKAKDKFEFLPRSAYENSFPQVDRSRREVREIGTLRMIARRLGRRKNPRWLRSNGIITLGIGVVEHGPLPFLNWEEI